MAKNVAPESPALMATANEEQLGDPEETCGAPGVVAIAAVARLVPGPVDDAQLPLLSLAAVAVNV